MILRNVVFLLFNLWSSPFFFSTILFFRRNESGRADRENLEIVGERVPDDTISGPSSALGEDARRRKNI